MMSSFVSDYTCTTSVEKDVYGSRLNVIRFSNDVLCSNMRWYIMLRWAVITILTVLQLLSIASPAFFNRAGLVLQGQWVPILIIVLFAANIVFICFIKIDWLARIISLPINISMQIALDLVCLTFVVHYLGSILTPAPFLYVFHIALSCVLFSVRGSLMVTLCACTLYALCLYFDFFGPFAVPKIFFSGLSNTIITLHASTIITWAFLIESIFLLIWYVVSRQTVIIRLHERELVDAHDKIKHSQIEKERFAVWMTHQLKAPLDAIRSNINLIKGGYCGEIQETVVSLIDRIDYRAKNMSVLILDVLKFAKLNDVTCIEKQDLIDISEVTHKCIDRLIPIADARDIRVSTSIVRCTTTGVYEQIEMLIENLISNAVTYSHDGNAVFVSCIDDPMCKHVVFSVKDHGIGIDPESLPQIFDAYFRTPEATQHNGASSGIGLSIVRTIAQSHKLKISVESEKNTGTTFTVYFKSVPCLN